MQKPAKILITAVMALLLAACQTPLPAPASLPPPIPCPPVEMGQIAVHQNQITGALTGVQAMCHRIGGNLSVNLDVAFAASRPHPREAYRIVLPYAVSILNEGGAVRSHEVYHVMLSFPAGAGSITQHEHLHQVIPVTPGNGEPARLVLSLAPAAQ